MKKVLLMPVVAAALFGAACGDNDDPMTVDTRPSVRFLNATTGMSGSGGFTANGQFTAGSALAFGQTTCAKVNEGMTSFGFGVANSGGTALNGGVLATLDNQNITTGGSYTVVATGPATNPTLLLLDNSFSGELGTNQAAVRAMNLDATTGTTYKYFVYNGGVGSTAIGTNLAFDGPPSAFSVTTGGAKIFSVLRIPGHTIMIEGTTYTLAAGSASTMAVLPTASGGAQLVHLSPCS